MISRHDSIGQSFGEDSRSLRWRLNFGKADHQDCMTGTSLRKEWVVKEKNKEAMDGKWLGFLLDSF